MTSLNDTIFDDVDGQNIDQDQEFPLKVTVSTALASWEQIHKDVKSQLNSLQSAVTSDAILQDQVIDKLLAAAIETRDELITKKECEMKNLHLLAEALNGLVGKTTDAPESTPES